MNKIYIKTVQSENELNSIFSSHLKDLKYEYPNFQSWYYSKVIQGVKDKSRNVIIAEKDGEIAGILITKSDPISLEKKICTLKVIRKYQRQGIGSILLEKSFEILKDTHPLITIPESKNAEFQRLFHKYDFVLSQKCLDYYKKGHSEFCYNGNLCLPSNKIEVNTTIVIPLLNTALLLRG